MLTVVFGVDVVLLSPLLVYIVREQVHPARKRLEFDGLEGRLAERI
jgi:hypothetical protein